MGRPKQDHVAGDADEARADLTLIEAVEASDTRAVLGALQLRIARTIQDPTTPPRDLAALSRRLMEISRDIEALDAADAEDDIGRAQSLEDAEFDPSSV